MATSEKIQLKGASQYKKDLQQIVAESKTLSSEMKMVKSSFDKSTTAQQKNEAIGKQLSKQIENQQKMVDKLRQAYEAEVAASGEQSVAAQKAKDALNKGQTVLNNLQAENRALAESEKEETKVSQAQTKAKESFNAITKATAVAVAAVATAVAAAAKALWNATTAAGQWADNLITLSAQTDISTDTLQKWDYAARFIDVDTNTMAKGLQKIQSQQTAAISSKKKYIQILGGERIALKDTNGEMKTTEQVFYEAIDAIGRIKDETKRNAAANDLFGKSYAELKPLIDAGTEGLKAYCDEAEALGLVFSEDDVNALGSFDDQMNKFQATMEASGKQLALAFLPQMQEVAETITGIASTIANALSDGFQDSDVDSILDAVFGKLSEGFQKVDKILPSIQKFVSGVIQKILEFAIKNLPTLAKTAVEIVVGLANSLIQVVSQNFGLLLQATLDIIQSIANGLIENLPTLIPALVSCILLMVETLTDPENIDMLMQAAIGLIQALGEGLIAAVPLILERLPQLITNIVEGLIVQGMRMYQAANALITKLADGIGQYMATIVPKIKQWVQEKIIQPIKEKGIAGLADAGRNLVVGLWNGIRDKFTWIKEKISNWVGDVVSWFKSKFGVHSPSTVFMGIGENLAEGLAIGWTDGMSYVRNAMSAVPGINGSYSLDASPAGMGGINVYIDGIKYNSDEYVDTSITNFVENMIRRSQMYGGA